MQDINNERGYDNSDEVSEPQRIKELVSWEKDRLVQTAITRDPSRYTNAMKYMFSLEIEKIYNRTMYGYAESCIFFADLYGCDVSKIPKLINITLRQKIEGEAINAKTIKTFSTTKKSISKWSKRI